MARTLRRSLGLAVALASIVFLAANASAQPADWQNPRNFNPYYLGTHVALGPEWLFSAEDNPAFASPTYDDSNWRVVSIDKPLASYGVSNIPHVWYRMHLHVHPAAHYLAIETQYIAGSYELYVNGVRLGANGRMDHLIQSAQNYLTWYEIPDSMIAPHGDLVIAIRLALDRMGRAGGRGTGPPLYNGSIMIGTRDAAQRDASYDAAHQAGIPLILFGLNFIVGIVALAPYIAMRTQLEYLAIAVSLLASGLQSAVIAWAHLHTATVPVALFTTFWFGITKSP